jgi:hypothetical protein
VCNGVCDLFLLIRALKEYMLSKIGHAYFLKIVLLLSGVCVCRLDTTAVNCVFNNA